MSDSCKYCSGDTAIVGKNSNVRLEIVGNLLIISEFNFVVLQKSIKFCPFCGTELKEIEIGIEE